jgi:peptidoglycan/xylan/chitin deacetylase (PgdA/CDA1 family)
MKAVMYHYVREYNPQLPFFRFLNYRNFEKQLDYFATEYGFVTREEWIKVLKDKNSESVKGKILLTFDDAMSCNYEYVFKILKKKGLWGIFYVPTQPYQQDKMLDVHRIHLLCGAFEGFKLLAILQDLLDGSMIPDEKIKEFSEYTYTNQKNFTGISEFKRILNYFVNYKYRESLINAVSDKLDFKHRVTDFYVSVDMIKEMYKYGNIIGSHSVSHPVMSKLSASEQRREINDSFKFLNSIDCIDIKTYCHPYGGFHSFNNETTGILNSMNVDFSFNVEPRDICDSDLKSSIQFLPRYDCNIFPFGKT